MSRRFWIIAVLKAFLVVCLVPVCTLVLSGELVQHLDNVWRDGVGKELSVKPGQQIGAEELNVFALSHLCEREEDTSQLPSLNKLCGRFRHLTDLRNWSRRALDISLLTIFFIVGLATVGRFSRELLPLCFVIAHRVCRLTLLFTLCSGTLLIIATLYLGEAIFWGKMPFAALAGLGGLMSFLSANLTFAAFSVFTTRRFNAFAKTAPLADHEHLRAALWRAARAAEAELPEHLLLGIGSRFYVTDLPVRSLDGEERGTTLFLSLPLLRVLSPAELTAVMAREFYQFGRNRSAMERRFRLSFTETVERLGDFHRAPGQSFFRSALHFPVLILMELPLNLFEGIARRALRESELSADHLAAQKFGNECLARALSKLAAVNEDWDRYRAYMKGFWSQGKPVKNASEFIATTSSLPESEIKRSMPQEVRGKRRADFSLSLKERLAALGITVEEAESFSRSIPTPSAITLVNQPKWWEETLTESEATGWNHPPRLLARKKAVPTTTPEAPHRKTGT